MLKVRRLKEPRGRVRFLSDDELARLRQVLDAGREDLRVVVLMALATGMRKMELLNLTWQDVDLTTGKVIIQDSKNGERRSATLVGEALEALRAYARVRRIDSDLVFPNQSGRRPFRVDEAFRQVVAEAQLADFRFHDCRHDFASTLARNGASLLEIAHALGHKDLSMVRRYAHLTESHMSEVVKRAMKGRFG